MSTGRLLKRLGIFLHKPQIYFFLCFRPFPLWKFGRRNRGSSDSLKTPTPHGCLRISSKWCLTGTVIIQGVQDKTGKRKKLKSNSLNYHFPIIYEVKKGKIMNPPTLLNHKNKALRRPSFTAWPFHTTPSNTLLFHSLYMN